MVSKSFSIFAIECVGSGKYDGGVKVGNDVGYSIGCRDVGLGVTIFSL